MNAFFELGLAEPITRALVEERYETPTPIQAQTIPQVLAGRDVVGIAQTGTGKTAAFALPILNHLANSRERPERRSCRVLVLSPTRELSGQIMDSFKTYGRHMRVSVTLAIGGVPIGKQIRAMANGVDVLVATPGRLLDLMGERAVTLDKVEILVLDEADRMLDMGFIHDIRRVVAKCPAQRQTLFFSATMARETEDLGRMMLRDPARVAVTPQASTAERVSQRVVHIDKSGKANLLADLLRSEPIDRAIVFTRTKHGADRVVRQLGQQGLAAEAIHGNKSQGQRERALAAFRNGKIKTLIATDIAARGIDVDGVSHVFNFDLPNVPESYVHRIGRTARAGAEGVAISFCDREERAYLRDIEKLIRMTLPASDGRTGEPVEAAAQRAARSGKPDKRPARPSRSQGQAAESTPDERKPRNRAGQRRRRREREAQAAQVHGNPQPSRQDRSQESRQAAPKADGGAADLALSSLGFMQDRRPTPRDTRRDAQAPR
ncbi:DEAD/DEAH box helicase [Pseudorhodoplanes sp.]|uniref:DEAD/DEAH box helicase n=1 Tax=Pseudorhodoplanes sp. TaxID=1934341 RepID=UPI00391B424E